MSHPHPSREHIMRTYRAYILGEKRRMAGVTNSQKAFRRGARSLLHYREYVAEYLEAKRDVIEARGKN